VLARLEVRVGEAEEDGTEGGAREEVGEELHGVGAQDGDVLVAACNGAGWEVVVCRVRRICRCGWCGWRGGLFCLWWWYGCGIELLLAHGSDLVLDEFGD